MERSTHNVVTVPRQNGNYAPVLPVPKPDRLVITARDNPWQFFVEFYRANVVQMACQREHALLLFIVPNLDLVVITSADEHVLSVMKVNCSYRTCIVKS